MTKAELDALRDRLARSHGEIHIDDEGQLMASDAFSIGWDAAMEHFPKWTPVSEGLPEEDEKVLAFFLPDFDEAYELKICTYDDDCRVWRETATDDRQDYIIAWMPLPEAYKP